MSSTARQTSSTSKPSRSPGHVYRIGQRVKRRQSISSQMTFGTPREGTIVDLTWTKTKAGATYPTYAVKFDHSDVIDQKVHQMRILVLD